MKSIKINDENEIIMGRGKYGYQKVLDNFEEAKKILIITYNISVNSEQKLINFLRKAKPECEVTIVTNVPGRFERYYNERAREMARGKIEKYTKVLNPDNYEFKVSIYYNTLNHAKFISTENIAYMGSQNFSDESKNNYESGILFTNKNLIQELWEGYQENLLTESLNYHNTNIDKKLLKLMLQTGLLLNIKDEIQEEFYIWSDDYPHIGEERRYFSKYAGAKIMTTESLDTWRTFFNEISETLEDIIIDFDDKLNEQYEKGEISKKIYDEEYKCVDEKISEVMDKIKFSSEKIDYIFYEYLEFDEEKYMWTKFDNNENINLLEHYQKEAQESKIELIKEDEILKFEQELEELIEIIQLYIVEIRERNKKYLNIDNTK